MQLCPWPMADMLWHLLEGTDPPQLTSLHIFEVDQHLAGFPRVLATMPPVHHDSFSVGLKVAHTLTKEQHHSNDWVEAVKLEPRSLEPNAYDIYSTSKANQFKSSKSNQNKFEQIKSKQIRRMSSAVFQPGKSKTQPALPKQQARAANPALSCLSLSLSIYSYMNMGEKGFSLFYC
jgi:hypothetical protein